MFLNCCGSSPRYIALTLSPQSITSSKLSLYLYVPGYVVNSGFFELIHPLLNKIDAKALIRVKGNMYPNVGSLLENDRHVDYEFEHKGAIYYINTNNGPTVLDDGTKIDCVENRILFFESHKNHNSTYCTDQKVRMNININYF